MPSANYRGIFAVGLLQRPHIDIRGHARSSDGYDMPRLVTGVSRRRQRRRQTEIDALIRSDVFGFWLFRIIAPVVVLGRPWRCCRRYEPRQPLPQWRRFGHRTVPVQYSTT